MWKNYVAAMYGVLEINSENSAENEQKKKKPSFKNLAKSNVYYLKSIYNK